MLTFGDPASFFKGMSSGDDPRADAGDESGQIDPALAERAEKLFDVKRNEAEAILDEPGAVAAMTARARDWMVRFSRSLPAGACEGLTTIFRMIAASWSGEYPGLERSTAAYLVAALIYCVSPVDVIPDCIPGIGLMDDVFVVSWTINALAGEIQKFRGWERLTAAKSALSSCLPYIQDVRRVVICSGWLTEGSAGDDVAKILAPVFPNATFECFPWESNVSWSEARDYADGPGGRELLDFIRRGSDDLSEVAVIGHSLGVRIAVRALAALAQEPEKKSLFSRKVVNRVAQAFFMGGAIDADDPDIPRAASASLTPACNFFSRADRALSYFYRLAEQATPVGLAGCARTYDNYVDCVVAGHEEYYLDVLKNVSSLVGVLKSSSVLSKVTVADMIASGVPKYLRHQFVFYADFLKNSVEGIDSPPAPEIPEIESESDAENA